MKKCIVLGASSFVGQYLLPLLAEKGIEVQSVGRATPKLYPADCLISLAPLWVLPPLFPSLAALGIKRIIAFSSTSRFSKQASPEPSEWAIAEKLTAAEQAMQQQSIPWTLLRPTLIYGDIPECPGKVVGTMLKIIQKFHCFPITGQSPGLRQPVHASDLAAACWAILNNSTTFNKAYNLSGGEVLSYKQMVERIFLTIGKNPCVISIPLSLLRVGIQLARLFPPYRFVNPQMADRAFQDLAFDHSEATRDFGYSPRGFFPIQ
ncbi:MAG: NAD(P)H-binding protein [Gammaproteobacteria bacterium]